MDQALDARSQKTAPPQKTEGPTAAQHSQVQNYADLTPVLQALKAGIPARALPPATLAELAQYLGNSAMEALLEAESPGPSLTRPQLGPHICSPAQTVTLERPELTQPPSFATHVPLFGPGGDPAALGTFDAVAWPTLEGGGGP